MKVLLRRIHTGEYLGPSGDWSADALLARDFSRVPDAVEFALRAGLNELRVVLYDPAHPPVIELPWWNMAAA